MTQPAPSIPNQRKTVGRCGAAILLMLAAGGLCAPLAAAADLTMGIQLEPDSIDPHFHYFNGTLPLTLQIFEPLVSTDGESALHPALAISWRTLNDTSWEFTLRPGVTFHDGVPLTAADVAFTLKRAPDVPHSPGGFGSYLREITSVETPDAGHVIIHTDGPSPLLPIFLSRIGIISEHVGRDATTGDYNTGRAAIGTGPYRFVSWAHGDRIVLKRNDAWWGKPPPWAGVQIRYIPNGAARVAALLAGDVDLVDAVSVEDVAKLKQDRALRVREAPSLNLIALQLDMAQRKPPLITGPNGETLDKNPLADPRVRRAVAMAINREALTRRVLNNEVVTATQIMQPGQFGYDPALKPLPYDPAQAKTLMRQAGYPDGFRLTMICRSVLYPSAPAVCQALAQMFVRIGIKTALESEPQSLFVAHANAHDYSLFDAFNVIDTAEPGHLLELSYAIPNAAKGWGGLNRGQYANPALDQLLDSASHETDAPKREATLRKAVDMVINDVAMIPLFRPLNIDAMRIGLDHAPRSDAFVFAADVHPVASQ